MPKNAVLRRPAGHVAQKFKSSAAVRCRRSSASVPRKRPAVQTNSAAPRERLAIDAKHVAAKRDLSVLDNSADCIDVKCVVARGTKSSFSGNSAWAIDMEPAANKANSSGSNDSASNDSANGIDAEHIVKESEAMHGGRTFSLTVTQSSGAWKQVDDVVLNMTVADLVDKIQMAFSFSDCMLFQDVVRLCVGDRLLYNHETLKDIGVSASTPVSLVVVHDLVTLQLGDGSTLRVAREIARMSNTIRTVMDNNDTDNQIPIENCKRDNLIKAMEYCAYHKDNPAEEIQKPLRGTLEESGVSSWDATFVNIDQENLFELILAANSLDIKPLLDLSCAKVASMIRGKNTEEIRKTFNIVNDFTPEEEARVREENRWCEDA